MIRLAGMHFIHQGVAIALSVATLMGALLSSTPALAWGALGHEVAGTIAAGYLSETARIRVQRLLGEEALGRASHWADRMRDNPAPYWQKTAQAYHYVTVPPGYSYRATGAPPRGDAITALCHFAADLRSPATTLAQRALTLRFSLHIVQDLHQPLHVGNGSDRGGNDIEVRVGKDVHSFHRVWDTDIIASERHTVGQWVEALEDQDLLRPPMEGDADFERWVAESGQLRDTLYPPPPVAGESYFRQQLPAARERLALAGIRSAAWINAVFAGPAPEDRLTGICAAVPGVHGVKAREYHYRSSADTR